MYVCAFVLSILEYIFTFPGWLCPQLCSGVDENAIGTCAELIFAPIDTSFSDDAPLLPSGFRIIPLDCGTVSVCLVWRNLNVCSFRALLLLA